MSPATTEPASQPTTRPLATVEPGGELLLEQLNAAYAKPGPRHVVGEIKGLFDVAGRSKAYSMAVEGRTDGHGRFLHDAGPAGLIVGNGKSAYLYDRRRDAFATLTAMADRLPADQIQSPLINILLDENPALLLSLTTEPAALLKRSVKTIRPAMQPSALVLERAAKRITLHLNSEDGTIRSSDIDFIPLMEKRGAAGVKAAGATLTYTVQSAEAPGEKAFDWQPPATATEFSAVPPAPPQAPATQALKR